MKVYRSISFQLVILPVCRVIRRYDRSGRSPEAGSRTTEVGKPAHLVQLRQFWDKPAHRRITDSQTRKLQIKSGLATEDTSRKNRKPKFEIRKKKCKDLPQRTQWKNKTLVLRRKKNHRGEGISCEILCDLCGKTFHFFDLRFRISTVVFALGTTFQTIGRSSACSAALFAG